MLSPITIKPILNTIKRLQSIVPSFLLDIPFLLRPVLSAGKKLRASLKNLLEGLL
jgi:hypothetical protein